MPESSLAVARRFYDASAFMRMLNEDFVVTVSEGMPHGLGGVYHDPRDATDVWCRIWALYDMRADPAEFLPVADGRVVVLGFYRGQARDGGSAVDARFAHVITAVGDRLAAFEQITDTARWVLPGLSPYLSLTSRCGSPTSE